MPAEVSSFENSFWNMNSVLQFDLLVWITANFEHLAECFRFIWVDLPISDENNDRSICSERK